MPKINEDDLNGLIKKAGVTGLTAKKLQEANDQADEVPASTRPQGHGAAAQTQPSFGKI